MVDSDGVLAHSTDTIVVPWPVLTTPPFLPPPSPNAADFVRKCLTVDARNRPDALDLYRHPWVSEGRGEVFETPCVSCHKPWLIGSVCVCMPGKLCAYSLTPRSAATCPPSSTHTHSPTHPLTPSLPLSLTPSLLSLLCRSAATCPPSSTATWTPRGGCRGRQTPRP